MPAAQLTDRFLDLSGNPPRMVMDLVTAVLQPGDALPPVAGQPRVHALAANPIPFGDLGHRNTGADFQHGAVSLLGHSQLPQHERECQASSEAKVGAASSWTAHWCSPLPVTSFSTASRARWRAPGQAPQRT